MPVKAINEIRDEMYDAIDAALWTFQWSRNLSDNFGEVSLDRDEGRLHLSVYCANSDDPDDEEFHGLVLSRDVDLYDDPKEQIRELIHFHLCHEADEQMWFDNERPFYPHNEDGSLR